MAVPLTETAGALELIAHGEDAWLVPPQQPHALADGVRLLLEDESLRARLASQGRKKVETHYSQQHIVNAYDPTCINGCWQHSEIAQPSQAEK